jgi:hypothetical protein
VTQETFGHVADVEPHLVTFNLMQDFCELKPKEVLRAISAPMIGDRSAFMREQSYTAEFCTPIWPLCTEKSGLVHPLKKWKDPIGDAPGVNSADGWAA